MKWMWLLIVLLVFPFALADSQFIDVEIAKNDLVQQHITLNITSVSSYDSYSYSLDREPLRVEADGRSEIRSGEVTTIRIFKMIFPGENMLFFTMVFDDLISREGSTRIFSTTFVPIMNNTHLKVTLPKNFVLANVDVPTSPRPKEIITDGTRITLEWNLSAEPTDVIVLYQGPSQQWKYVAFVFILLACLVSGYAYYAKNKKFENRDVVFGPDERQIVDLLRREKRTQKELCELTHFSKSKMSKVIRKLEEKHVVIKAPHYKTNKIKIKKEWE